MERIPANKGRRKDMCRKLLFFDSEWNDGGGLNGMLNLLGEKLLGDLERAKNSFQNPLCKFVIN